MLVPCARSCKYTCITVNSMSYKGADLYRRLTNLRISDVMARTASLSKIYGSIDPYRYSSVFIEDALGFTIPVPLDFHPSWEVSGLDYASI
jgi:hypothetical protein